MSSLRFKGRNHRERAQPLEREKWGILEKSKDYKLRAADYREKKKRLKILREKASDRNPDEFSFKMLSTKTSKGVKLGDRGNKAMSQDVVKLLKTQDAGYIRTMLQKVRKERERLEEGILLEEGEAEVTTFRDRRGEKRHKVFVDNEGEQKEFTAEEWFGTDADVVERAWNRRRKSSDGMAQEDQEESGPPTKAKSLKQLEAEHERLKEERAARKKRQRERESHKIRLQAIKAREQDLMQAEQELEEQRAKMSNSAGGVNKHGTKFKPRERKR